MKSQKCGSQRQCGVVLHRPQTGTWNLDVTDKVALTKGKLGKSFSLLLLAVRLEIVIRDELASSTLIVKVVR